MTHVNTTNDLQSLEQEAYRHTISDGLMEIFAGMMFLMLSNLYTNTMPIAIIVLFMLVIFPRAIKEIRKKWIYPRIGYVKVKQDTKFEWVSFLIFMGTVTTMAGILVLLLPGGYSDTDNLYRVAPFAIGMVMFGPAFELVDRSGQDIYYLVGILPMISGLAITAASVINEPWAPFRGLQIFSILWGNLALAIGFIRLAWFLHKHPHEEETPDE